MARNQNLSEEEQREAENKKQSLLSKFKLDKHHRIERFGVSLISVVLCLAMLTTSVYIKQHNDNKVVVGDTPIYTTAFETSLTHNTGSIINIYRSEDGTKATILLKFDDMNNMKTDAKNYQMWVTGYDSYYQDTTMTGGVYVYGRSGYMALCFLNPNGFSNQICDIILRSNDSIVESYVSSSTPKDDSSFSQYDQIRIYANLGAKKMPVGQFMTTEDGSLLDSVALYDETILLPQIDSTKTQLNTTLASMQLDLKRMDEYEADLDRLGMTVFPRDESFKNDTITNYQGDVVEISSSEDAVSAEVTTENTATGDAVSADTTSGEATTSDSTTEVIPEENPYTDLLQLHTDYVFPYGFDFDWQSYDILGDTRLIDSVKGDMATYQYLNSLDALRTSEPTPTLNLPTKWVRKDGQEFIASEKFQQENDDDIATDISLLTSAYTDYYNLKLNYQITLQTALLEYEYQEENFAAKASINAEKDCCQVWQRYNK